MSNQSNPTGAPIPATSTPVTSTMATATQTAANALKGQGAGSNLAVVRQGWFDKMKELGERKGGGTAAELEAFEDMVERAHPPRSEITPDDAQHFGRGVPEQRAIARDLTREHVVDHDGWDRGGEAEGGREQRDRKSTRLNSSHSGESRMPSSA